MQVLFNCMLCNEGGRMIIVDAHCDTLTKSIDNHMNIIKNSLHWDITRASKFSGFVQFLAIFQDPGREKPTMARVRRYIHAAEKTEKKSSVFRLCKCAADITKGLAQNRVCGLLAIEGGDCLEGETGNLQKLYNMGVRCITLTWNNANELGDGCEDVRYGGLTNFGRKIVRLMQDIGIIVDISHADEKTFWDCMEECTKPVIASHSNAKTIFYHSRNLDDNQICAIAKARGVIGVNFYTEFIGAEKSVHITGLLRHIEHICAIAGEDHVCIGADFDGMESLPLPIRGVQDMDILFQSLARLNYTDNVISKIAGGNLLRVIMQILKD